MNIVISSSMNLNPREKKMFRFYDTVVIREERFEGAYQQKLLVFKLIYMLWQISFFIALIVVWKYSLLGGIKVINVHEGIKLVWLKLKWLGADELQQGLFRDFSKVQIEDIDLDLD